MQTCYRLSRSDLRGNFCSVKAATEILAVKAESFAGFPGR